MVASNVRLRKTFPQAQAAGLRKEGGVPDRMVRAAADRGILSQFEAWLDFCENQDSGVDPKDLARGSN